MADQDVEYFKPTNGRVVGVLGLLVALGLIVLLASDGLRGADVPVILGIAFGAVLVWAAIVRPRVGVSREVLVLHNLASTVTIPLISIEQLVIRQFLEVRVEGQRFVSPAVGRSLRDLRKRSGRVLDPVSSYTDFIEDRLDRRLAEAKELASKGQPAPAVRRDWAWPELVAIVVTGTGFLVSLFL
ncbi:hypothetical protein [Nocardioides sp.]|uniref:hypothetical protein n=1 Tax=Nocardioides sp. TaxID=35761 RepID=UPI003D0E7437